MGATLLYLVPFALFVAPSFVAAGATALFVEGSPGDKAVPAEQGGQGGKPQKPEQKGEKIQGMETVKKPAEI